MENSQKNLLIGVCGSIASYRAADLAREAMRNGFKVRVCLTESATHFVGTALFEGLTGEPCLVNTFEEPLIGKMAHIEWARWADLIAIVPATASTISKLAQGIADNMLTTIALASNAPWVVAPAMNPSMYSNEGTQASLKILRERAAVMVEPKSGDVACGENGQGKLASNSEILAAIQLVMSRSMRLQGKKILITSGPSREPIDNVRFLSNRSSGKMGFALARAALLMGGDVTVISGPTSEAAPSNAKVISVFTANDFLEAGLMEIGEADYVIGAAAISDYRVSNPAKGKIRRGEGKLNVELVPNPDIIAELAKRNPNACAIGLAAEPSADLAYAQEKMTRKGLFAIAVNDISRQEIGFESDSNEFALIFRNGRVENSGMRSKLACALWLLEKIAEESSETAG